MKAAAFAILVAAAACGQEAPAPADAAAGDGPRKPAVSPNRAFRPGGLPVDADRGHELSGPVALILPLDAPGLVGEAAAAFLRGYEDAAAAAGIRAAIDIYGTDGRIVSGLAAYRQAVEEGSGVVVAAMVRGVADRIAALEPRQRTFSLLLQLPDDPDHALDRIYFFPLGAEIEAGQFVRDVAPGFERTYVLIEPSMFGGRMLDAVRSEWGRRDASGLIERQMINDDSWRELHNELRAFLESEDDDAGPRVELPPPAAVFAAGSRTFASRARLNVPSAIKVYVPAATFTGVRQRASARLVASRGMRFFEMPALLDDGDSSLLPQPPAAGASRIAQRFYAAGLDSFAILAAAAIWSSENYWQGEGATGAIRMRGRSFVRDGVLVEVGGAGKLLPVQQGLK